MQPRKNYSRPYGRKWHKIPVVIASIKHCAERDAFQEWLQYDGIRASISRAVTEMLRTVNPPSKLTISEWADRYRRLSSESSAEPGCWVTHRAEYQRDIMDAISEPGVERVVSMRSAQVGKTGIINNVVGFRIAQDAAPVLQPTHAGALRYRITAILEEFSTAPAPFGSFQPQKRMRGGGAHCSSSDRLKKTHFVSLRGIDESMNYRDRQGHPIRPKT